MQPKYGKKKVESYEQIYQKEKAKKDEREGKPPSLRLSPRNCLGMWSKLISLAEAKQWDLLVRLGTVEQGMFEEKSLDPDKNGDLGSINLEQTASWLSCEVSGETREVAISDLATDEGEEEEEEEEDDD